MMTLHLCETKDGAFYFAGYSLPPQLSIVNDDGSSGTPADAARVNACMSMKIAKVSTRYFANPHTAMNEALDLGYDVIFHPINGGQPIARYAG